MTLQVSASVALVMGFATPALGQDAPVVDPRVSGVVSGGWWDTDSKEGQLRLVVVSEGWEHLRSAHYLQWVAAPDSTGRQEIVSSVRLDEIDVPVWVTAPDVEIRDGHTVFILRQYHTNIPGKTRTVEVHPGDLGYYSVAYADSADPSLPNRR